MKRDNCIEITNISFSYPGEDRQIFKDFSIQIPEGMTTLVGQNGSGKSTLMLLAGARLYPEQGKIVINGVDTTTLHNEETRNRIASFVYQNMEFETDEPVGELLKFVYKNGLLKSKDSKLISELVTVFQLEEALDKQFQNLSKGDMQKVVIAFSMLYGSKVIFMDEPVFALEDHQKQSVMEYIRNFQQKNSISVIYSAHEIELSQEFSDYAVLFHKGGKIESGPTAEILVADKLESAYGIPFAMLNKKDQLFREHLMDLEKYGPEIARDINKGDILN